MIAFEVALGLAAMTPGRAADVATSDGSAATSAADWPPLTSAVPVNPQIESRIAALLRQLTLEQKVAQMVQPDIRDVTPEDVKVYRLGSVLNGGGAFPGNNKHAAVSEWVSLADQFYAASMDTSTGAPAIPIIWGTDAVHGHSNVFGATLFPHNIGLGAMHDPDLMVRIGEATAREVAVTGIDWTFAPTVAVVRDDRWGRGYESYSEDPEIVRSYAGSIVRGLQGAPGTPAFLNGNHIVATAKHFVGDGGTQLGIDRGNTCASERELLEIHAQGYIAAIQAGVQTVMVSYNSWHGAKLHGQKQLITDVLKRRLGFDGVVVSDWDGIDEVQGCSKDKCAQAIDAGIDLFMVPTQWKGFIGNTVAQVRAGAVAESRIDDAVTRILRVKLRAGLFEKGRPSSRPLANHRELLGAQEHRAVAREAVRKSLVLLKNSRRLLPLSRRMNVLVAGDGADDISMQTGGWTISWQGTGNSNQDFPGATSVFEGIRSSVTGSGGTATLSRDGSFRTKPDVAIVVFGEHPYAEWYGDITTIDHPPTLGEASVNDALPAPEASAPGTSCENRAAPPAPKSALAAGEVKPNANLALLRSLKERGVPVVAVFLTGRPLWITPELDAADAFVVAWLPGTEGGGVADVLFKGKDGKAGFGFTGTLSRSWPRDPTQTVLNRNDANYQPLFPYGFGLTY